MEIQNICVILCVIYVLRCIFLFHLDICMRIEINKKIYIKIPKNVQSGGAEINTYYTKVIYLHIYY